MADDQPSIPILIIDGPRAIIRLNRPKLLNRLQQDDLDTLMAQLAQVEADASIRVLVLTGTGRAFSAGFDLKAIAARAGSAAPASSAHASFETVANRLENPVFRRSAG